MAWNVSRLIPLTISALLAFMPDVLADPIGAAATAENKVTGTVSGRTSDLGAGDNVFSNEIIKTATGGNARLVFLDKTDLKVGPLATIVLDKFVYNPDSSAKDAVLSVTKGAFRFVTGNSDSHNFQIKTPIATIGVRGTIVYALVKGANLAVLLDEGAAYVCHRGKNDQKAINEKTGKGCLPLDDTNNFLLIKADGTLIGPQPAPPDARTRLSGCVNGREADCSLENLSRLASLEVPTQPGDKIDAVPTAFTPTVNKAPSHGGTLSSTHGGAGFQVISTIRPQCQTTTPTLVPARTIAPQVSTSCTSGTPFSSQVIPAERMSPATSIETVSPRGPMRIVITF